MYEAAMLVLRDEARWLKRAHAEALAQEGDGLQNLAMARQLRHDLGQVRGALQLLRLVSRGPVPEAARRRARILEQGAARGVGAAT